MHDIYEPREDSYLMSEFLKKIKIEKSSKILEIGSGSGIQTKTIIQKGTPPENLVLSDINRVAVIHLTKKFPKSKVILSDLFSNIKGNFDIILFNPPYLPEEPRDNKKDTTGGKKGPETINKFLFQAGKHLNKKGFILLITSSLTGKINWQKFEKKLLSKKKVFFEELYLWKLTPNPYFS